MKVGKISSYDLLKNYPKFYSEMNGTAGSGYVAYCNRVLHNQEQVVRCQLRDGSASPNGYIKYWNMDGTEAAQFTIGLGGVPYKNILDITWVNDEQKFAYVTMDPSLVTGSTYNIYKCDSDGLGSSLLISEIDTSQYAPWATASTSGYVGISSSNSDLFLKIGRDLYKIPEGSSGTWASISGALQSSTNSFHFGDGSNCRNLMFQPASGTTASGYLLYTWYDSDIDVLYLRAIDSTTLEYQQYRWAMLNISDYGSVKEPIFLNQLDYDSLHYYQMTTYSGVSTTLTFAGTFAKATNQTAYFNVFNIDDALAAFLNVNSSDTVMPAGIGATADIIATVCNCWGTTLSGKLVQFWVSSGDGGIYPAYAYTDSLGKAQTEFTTGQNVGVSTISVVVNEV